MRKGVKVFFSMMIVVALLLTSVCGVFAENNGRGNGNGNGHSKSFQKIRFNDVEEDFWAYQAIQSLTDLGIINGFPDKSFKPNESVTRSQFASMLSKALDLTATNNTQTFADVPPTSWEYKAVEASAIYLTGYRTSNGTLYFYGSRNAVREDMAVALVRALNITLVSDNGQLQQVFSDYEKITPSLRDYVYTAYTAGIMLGSGNKFNPQNNLTRAEAATLLLRALQKTEKVPVDDGQKVPIDNTNQSDATLSNLTYNSTTVTGFSPAKLSYNIVLPAGTTAIPTVVATANAIGKATASVTQAAGLPGSATVIVIAEDGTTHKTYTINFTVASVVKSTDATLSNLAVNGVTVPGFAPGKLTYNVVLAAGTTASPVVTATVKDTGKATANIVQTTGLPGYAYVVVTAENGITHKTYIINFTVAASAKHNDAALSNLTINGVTVTGFAPGTLTYNMVLAAGTTAIPAVAATVNDTGKATAVVTQATGLPGHATVVVTAENGITQRVYIVNFTVAAVVKHTDAALSNLTMNGVTVTGFAPATLAYNMVLATGTTAVPIVAATVNDTGKATAVVTQATGLPGSATVVVTAEDGTTQRVYIVNFTVAAVVKHTDATLSSLAIDGMALTGFTPELLTYDLVLPAGTAAIPVVTATVNDTGKATAVVTQATYFPGHATVVVTAEDGVTQKTYTIGFVVSAL